MTAVGTSAARPSLSHPNREKRASQTLRAAVVTLLLASAALLLAITVGGWTRLQGLTPLDFAWAAAYLLIAYRVARWARGSLPIAAALALLLFTFLVVAMFGLSGASWSDRARPGYAPAHDLFGGPGLSAHTLQSLSIALACAQLVLLVTATRAFTQRWNR